MLRKIFGLAEHTDTGPISSHSKVGRQVGQTYVVQTERIETARENVSVWTKGSAWPLTDEGILRIPFQFLLPLDVQPSCKYGGISKDGDVSYLIEAVGVRNGLLSLNRRVSKPFAVVPPDPVGLELRKSLLSGWTGPLRTISKSENMRRGVWGSYAESKAEVRFSDMSPYLIFCASAHGQYWSQKLIIPDLSMFPLFTKIPFTLRITTTTKEMKYDEKDEQKEVFPEPPRTPQAVIFILRRKMKVNAKGWKDNGQETIGHLGGLGKDSESPATESQSVSLTFDKKWVSLGDEKKVGSWRQETVVESAFELKCTPSFLTPILEQRVQILIYLSKS